MPKGHGVGVTICAECGGRLSIYNTTGRCWHHREPPKEWRLLRSMRYVGSTGADFAVRRADAAYQGEWDTETRE